MNALRKPMTLCVHEVGKLKESEQDDEGGGLGGGDGFGGEGGGEGGGG